MPRGNLFNCFLKNTRKYCTPKIYEHGFRCHKIDFRYVFCSFTSNLSAACQVWLHLPTLTSLRLANSAVCLATSSACLRTSSLCFFISFSLFCRISSRCLASSSSCQTHRCDATNENSEIVGDHWLPYSATLKNGTRYMVARRSKMNDQSFPGTKTIACFHRPYACVQGYTSQTAIKGKPS